MKRINFLMIKFLWRYPKLKRTLAIVILLIGIVTLTLLSIRGNMSESVSTKELLTLKFFTGIVVFLVCFIFYIWLPVSVLSEDRWKINGYVIREAERILEENSEFKELEELIGDAKIKEGVIKLERKDGLKKNKTIKLLKKWIDNFEEYEKLRALVKEYEEIKSKELELAKKVLDSGNRFGELRGKLGIYDDEGEKYWKCMCYARNEKS